VDEEVLRSIGEKRIERFRYSTADAAVFGVEPLAKRPA
jgi:hypothetical protein